MPSNRGCRADSRLTPGNVARTGNRPSYFRMKEGLIQVSSGSAGPTSHGSPWFLDVARDTTLVLTDYRNPEMTVLCLTDTD